MVAAMAQRLPAPTLLCAVLLAAIGLAACDGPDLEREQTRRPAPAMQVAERLDCPEQQGSLRRISMAADGRNCEYEGRNGSVVMLRILQLDGATVETALAPIEAELKARLPARPPSSEEASAASEESGSGDEVNINLPGINIDANDSGANIRIGGVRVRADGDHSDVRLDPISDTDEEGAGGPVVRRISGRGDVTIDANDQGAEIRISAPGRGVALTYILASSEAGPSGDRLVAYEARGPAGGPLVVGTLRSRGNRHNGPIEPMKRLVRLNTGG